MCQKCQNLIQFDRSANFLYADLSNVDRIRGKLARVGRTIIHRVICRYHKEPLDAGNALLVNPLSHPHIVDGWMDWNRIGLSFLWRALSWRWDQFVYQQRPFGVTTQRNPYATKEGRTYNFNTHTKRHFRFAASAPGRAIFMLYDSPAK